MQVTVSLGDKGENCSWEFKPNLLTLEIKSNSPATKKVAYGSSMPSALLGMCFILELVCFPRRDYQAFSLLNFSRAPFLSL